MHYYLQVFFLASNDSVQFIKTNWVENSEGVIIVNLHKELLEYYNVNFKKFSLRPREKIASDSTIGFANAIEKYDEEYFKNSSIIIAILEENSGSYRHKYDAYSVNKIDTSEQFNSLHNCPILLLPFL